MKHGVYRVGNQITFSKLEAIEMHTKTGIHPHWDFNEAVFEKVDWLNEPNQDILEIYRDRAQQIRDQYDYIILHYSGGADSQTVLESFVNNDIKLDEIVSHVNYTATGDPDNFLNSEAFRVSIPNGKVILEKCPWMIHRILDVTDLTIDYFKTNDAKWNWIYNLNMLMNPNNAAGIDLGLKVREWADLMHQGKKVCMLWGIDKPRMINVNGRWAFRFIDLVDSGPKVSNMAGLLPYYDELFYWTPDMPRLLVKQAHLIRRYMDQPGWQRLMFITEKSNGLVMKKSGDKKLWLSNDGVHQLIYPNWNINTFSAGKSASTIFSSRDQWFFQKEETLLARRNWRVGIEKYWSLLPAYWRNDPNNIAKGVRGCVSKLYWITP
jgi:hypothetical protein